MHSFKTNFSLNKFLLSYLLLLHPNAQSNLELSSIKYGILGSSKSRWTSRLNHCIGSKGSIVFFLMLEGWPRKTICVVYFSLCLRPLRKSLNKKKWNLLPYTLYLIYWFKCFLPNMVVGVKMSNFWGVKDEECQKRRGKNVVKKIGLMQQTFCILWTFR